MRSKGGRWADDRCPLGLRKPLSKIKTCCHLQPSFSSFSPSMIDLVLVSLIFRSGG